MSAVYITKTQHYLKVKKPLLERQRRARISKCLDALKTLIAEFRNDDAIMRMDKAEMLESAIAFMRAQQIAVPPLPMEESFRNGYMNAVNEVSRVMASMSGMNVAIGKAVMIQLGFEFNRLLHCSATTPTKTAGPMSPASSGYHSDCDVKSLKSEMMPGYGCGSSAFIWRPWSEQKA